MDPGRNPLRITHSACDSAPSTGEHRREIRGGEQADRKVVADMLIHLDHLHVASPTLDACIHSYFEDFAARVHIGDAATTTLKTYRSYSQHIPLEMRSRPATAVRRADVKVWHRALAARVGADGHKLTAAADNALKVLSCVYAWLIDEEELPGLESSPTTRVKRVHREVGGRALEDDELEEWRDAVDIHEHARTLRVRGLKMGHPRLCAAFSPTVALRLLDLTGARSSEVRTLRVEDLRFTGRPRFTLRTTKTGEGKARALSSAAVAELRRHLARLDHPTAGWLFPSARRPGSPISDSCLTKAFNRVAAIAAIEGASRHSLRHTMITRGFRLGFGSSAAAGAAGNKKEEAFTTYRHDIPEESYGLLEAHARRTRRAA
jgi:integrase